MDWIVRISDERLARPEFCDGMLEILDADSQAVLTRLPIRIINSRIAAPAQGEAAG